MLLNAILFFLLAVLNLGAAQTPTPTLNSSNTFIRAENGVFMLGDEPFRYIGTTAYWLQLLDNDEDMNRVLTDIASYGIKVVRTWAFNDVTEIPSTGPWIRAFHPNGTITINTGENGLGRLDRIVRVAHQVGVWVLFSLTNNWAPRAVNATALVQADGTVLDGSNLPRNYLSNDYGGMDTYVRHFTSDTTTDVVHDTFYISETIRSSFQDYIKFIVNRYKDETAVIAWETANDPRCNSTLPATNTCNANVITHWTANTTAVIKDTDPNHLVASGDSGFYCVECTKVFPYVPPPPGPSSGLVKREGPLTRAKLFAKDAAWKKRNLPQAPKRRNGISIRGKWSAPADASVGKRETNSFGPLYDGTFGVDAEDLANVPGIDFSSFQFFPDQNTYGPLTTSGTSNFSQVVESGVDWIKQHAQTANTYGRPSALNSFGLATNSSSNTFAPFNSSVVVPQSGIGTSQDQQTAAYTAWIDAAIASGVQGITHYQWGTRNITSSSSPAITNQSGVEDTNTSSISTFSSPNDGYATYADAVKRVLSAGASRLAAAGGRTTRKRLARWEF